MSNQAKVDYDKKEEINEIDFNQSWNETNNGNYATSGSDEAENSYSAVLYPKDEAYQIIISGKKPGAIVSTKLMTLKEVVNDAGDNWRTSKSGVSHKYFRGSRPITKDGKEFLEQYSGNLFEDTGKLKVAVSHSPMVEAGVETSNTADNLEI